MNRVWSFFFVLYFFCLFFSSMVVDFVTACPVVSITKLLICVCVGLACCCSRPPLPQKLKLAAPPVDGWAVGGQWLGFRI